MPSRLATLKLQAGKKVKRPAGPSRQAILPGVGYIRDDAKNGGLKRSNTSVSTSSSITAVSAPATTDGPEKVVLQLAEGTELPSVPYKLRFALSSQEWDERIECISRHRERSAKAFWEAIWFFFAFAIPAAITYPLYTVLFASITSAHKKQVVPTGQDPHATASLITIGIALLSFLLLATPLFIRKYVLQRRMNRDLDQWAAIDRRKTDEANPDVRWRVRLPNLFRTACHIHIPVPPRKRSISLEAALEKDRMASLTSAGEYGGGVALSRVDSIASNRSMFED